ncbi:SusD/RagB family nutrient-binding outer membrane lipoprotein [Puia sp. P3]|uniref:SusD/RagB family nutrient-binding outer membrane lipoprotein n=1 Tax=Puia sp. P3 TaxID=3423952 RepID=UPI003D67CD91
MKKSILYISALFLLAATGCKKFVDVNKDPNNPLAVQEKILLAPIEYNIAHGIACGGEADAATYTNHFMQIVCYNQVALNYGTYYFVNTNMNQTRNTGYQICLENLKVLRQQSAANGNYNYKAISEVLTAYTLAFLTDLWGDIPYSKALQGAGNFLPTYDKQESIYDSVQALLDQAVVDIDKKAGAAVGPDDYFYKEQHDAVGENSPLSLKARYYMHLTKAPGHTAAAQAQLAMTALQSGMTGTADEWKFAYPGSSTSQNIWYVNMQPLSTLVASSAIVDTLKARNDPRLPLLITEVDQ